ncbi:MAG: transglycosylase SLT domain-containing protein [Bacteroidota bacterium]
MWRKILPLTLGMAAFLWLLWPSEQSPGPLPQAIEVEDFNEYYQAYCVKVIQDSSLYLEEWDTLPQPNFWRHTIRYGPDTVIVNIAKTRQIIGYTDLRSWRAKSDGQKQAYEDSVRQEYGLGRKDEIFFTTGRSHFYNFEYILPDLDESIEVFLENNTDPWYAQAILLIESPGRLQYSTDGAYGSFQLMESVAREMGLKINAQVDERTDLRKSAKAAARLLRTVCLPQARSICYRHRLDFDERDLWFRLLVMHVYHAGATNVKRVMNKVRPQESGIQLFEELWQTKSRRFGNASQNYSQIILACWMELDKMLETKGLLCPPEEEEEASEETVIGP